MTVLNVAILLGALMMPATAVSGASVRVNKDDVSNHEDMKLRQSHPHLYLFDEGDYDGDGVKDSAAFIKTSNAHAEAIVTLGGSGRVYQLEAGLDLRTQMPRMGLMTAGPATFQTACGKGSGDDSAPCEPSITTTRDTVLVVVFEAGAILYAWDGKGFKETIISD